MSSNGSISAKTYNHIIFNTATQQSTCIESKYPRMRIIECSDFTMTIGTESSDSNTICSIDDPALIQLAEDIDRMCHRIYDIKTAHHNSKDYLAVLYQRDSIWMDVYCIEIDALGRRTVNEPHTVNLFDELKCPNFVFDVDRDDYDNYAIKFDQGTELNVVVDLIYRYKSNYYLNVNQLLVDPTRLTSALRSTDIIKGRMYRFNGNNKKLAFFSSGKKAKYGIPLVDIINILSVQKVDGSPRMSGHIEKFNCDINNIFLNKCISKSCYKYLGKKIDAPPASVNVVGAYSTPIHTYLQYDPVDHACTLISTHDDANNFMSQFEYLFNEKQLVPILYSYWLLPTGTVIFCYKPDYLI
jgi:hypothetical protein